MSDMKEETVEMAQGCPERALVDIDKRELEAGRYDMFVNALNAALRHLEVTDVKAFISKQDLSGRWKFELARATADVPGDVVDSKDGVKEMTGTVDDTEDADKADMQESPGQKKYVPQEGEILLGGDSEDPDGAGEYSMDGCTVFEG